MPETYKAVLVRFLNFNGKFCEDLTYLQVSPSPFFFRAALS